MSINLTQQASKGAFWGLVNNFSVSFISFIGTAIMARILSPGDFGLIGMAVLITESVNLFGNLGLGAAIIQKNNIDDDYLSTAFWASMAVSILLFLIGVVCAPLASLFFNEIAIKWIVIILSLNFIISSFSSVHTNLLYKMMLLKKIAIIEVVARISRIVIMLILAFMGFRFWSIIIGMVAERILKTILVITIINWRPKYTFAKEKFNELFRFGRNIYGQGFLTYFSQNMDFIITGRLLGTNMLGIYQFSYNMPYLVHSYVRDGIGPVLFPVFSKVNSNQERLSRGFFRALKYTAIIAFPILTLLSFCANDFVAIVYGSKWLSAITPLRLLCFSAALASMHDIVGLVFNALGRPDIGLKWGLFRLPLTIGCVIFCSKWGIIGIAVAMLFVEISTTVLSYMATKLLKAKFEQYWISLLPAMCASIIMLVGLIIFNYKFVTLENIYVRFFGNAALGGVLYLSVLFVFYKTDLFDMISFISLIFKSPIVVSEGIKNH